MEDSERAAGDCGVFGSRFENMTPAELTSRIEAFNRREEREQERAAWMVMHLLSAWVKKPPTVDQLLGRVTDA